MNEEHTEQQLSPPPSLARLFLAFLRLGSTSFGGPSIVAYIGRMVVEKKHWMSEGSFLEGVALCQILPGATAMQAAAYVGFKVRGVIGAAASFIGFGLPAFVLMMAFSALYTRTNNLPAVTSAFSGLQAIVVAIIANAAVSFGRTTLKDWRTVAISLIAAWMFAFRGSPLSNPIVVIFCSMLLGIALRVDIAALKSQVGSTVRSSRNGIIALLAFTAAFFILLFVFSRLLFSLASVMSVVSLLSFGGGFSCIPIMLHEIVDVRHWLDLATFNNGIVLGQVTPGPIMITATFVGYLSYGPLGGLVATTGIFLPSFFVLVWTVPYFKRMLASSYFVTAAGGAICSFVGLLVTVGMRFFLDVHWDTAHAFLAIGSFIALLCGTEILWVVLAGTALSVLLL
jgi:chromate transporter